MTKRFMANGSVVPSDPEITRLDAGRPHVATWVSTISTVRVRPFHRIIVGRLIDR